MAMSPEARAAALKLLGQELDAHDSPIPIGLTASEKLAALDPGLAPKESSMDTKPGYKTTEFWVTILAKALVAAIGYFTVTGGPLDEITAALQAGGGFAAVVVPLAKVAAGPFFAWLASKIASKYVDSRTAVKTAGAAE